MLKLSVIGVFTLVEPRHPLPATGIARVIARPGRNLKGPPPSRPPPPTPGICWKVLPFPHSSRLQACHGGVDWVKREENFSLQRGNFCRDRELLGMKRQFGGGVWRPLGAQNSSGPAMHRWREPLQCTLLMPLCINYQSYIFLQHIDREIGSNIEP